jgi:hypothetical protein
MGGNLGWPMREIITTYLAVVLFVSLGSFGVTALLHAKELQDPMRPPPLALQKMRKARLPDPPKQVVEVKPKEPPMQLTEIIYSRNRKVAIIDDQLLVVGDKIRGAKLVKLTRESARLVRSGKVITLSLNQDFSSIRKKAVGSDL